MIVGLAMLGGGVAAGVFGSLLGLGGGVLIVPLLTLGFGLPLREAVGISLVSVIVTSSAAAGVYLERHVANLRLGMSLELFTAMGALVGGLVAFAIDERLLALLFAGLLGYVAVTMARSAAADRGGGGVVPASADETVLPPPAEVDVPPPRPDAGGFVERLSGPGYHVGRLGTGVVGATGAGIVSALLGIGGGTVKVPLMHLAMGVPLRVATATSNLMIGITAAAGAAIYFLRGGIDAYVAGPIAIGVFVGATVGSRIAPRVDVRFLRWAFVIVLGYTAIQMLLRAIR